MDVDTQGKGSGNLSLQDLFDALANLWSDEITAKDLNTVLELEVLTGQGNPSTFDIEALCARLLDMIQFRDSYRTLSNLQGSQAKAMLDLLQNLIDFSSLDSRFKDPFVGALIRLSGKSGVFPHDLVQQDVILNEEGPIAGGAFGEISRGSLRGQAVAVKMLKFYQRSNFVTHLKTFSSEALIWRQARHPNVLPFICVYRHPSDVQNRFGLVSPWMQHGNIQDFLVKEPDADRKVLVIGIAKGLAYLHSSKPAIIHGDLKAVNVLITDTKTACIADFGLARARSPDMVNFSTQNTGHGIGTVRWMAPELFDHEEDADVHTTASSDIYAFGCVCYEIFSGRIPFHGITVDYQIMKRVLSGSRPERPENFHPSQQSCVQLGLTDDLWSNIGDCWCSQPGDRPTAKAVQERWEITT